MVAFAEFEAMAPGSGFITPTESVVAPLGMVTVAWRSVEETKVVVTTALATWICAPLTKLMPSTSRAKLVPEMRVAVAEETTGIGLRMLTGREPEVAAGAVLTAVMVTAPVAGITVGGV